VVSSGELQRWREVLLRLQRGPSPCGDRFDLCRRVLGLAFGTPEAQEAARLLLEGAMADATTEIADAQDVMRILKAIGRSEVELAELLTMR
jgi:hypothetical protein